MIAGVLSALRGHRFRPTAEADLQAAIAGVLEAAGLPVAREVALGAHDRIDLLVGDVGIEVKVDGSRADLARQLQRYAEHAAVGHLVLATTRRRHEAEFAGAVFAGKAVHVVRLAGGFL